MADYIRPACILPETWADMSGSHRRKVIEGQRNVEFTHRSGHVERMPQATAWYLAGSGAGSVRPGQ